MTIRLTELLDEIERDVFRLTHVWETFRYLFATEKRNVDTMNAVSGGFFLMVQQLLFDDAVLRVSRITDPARNRKQENLSLERLLEETGWKTTHPTKWQKYRSRLDDVEAACRPCRDHRNKRVSHKAVELFTKKIAIHDPMMKMIDDARGQIHEFLHDIRIDLGHGSLSFVYPDADREAEKLIDHLTNRASQKNPQAPSIIAYDSASREGHFFCAYCGAKEALRYYRRGSPSVEEVTRWHWSRCHGVVGYEQLVVETTDLTGSETPSRFVVDLSAPMTSGRG